MLIQVIQENFLNFEENQLVMIPRESLKHLCIRRWMARHFHATIKSEFQVCGNLAIK